MDPNAQICNDDDDPMHYMEGGEQGEEEIGSEEDDDCIEPVEIHELPPEEPPKAAPPSEPPAAKSAGDAAMVDSDAETSGKVKGTFQDHVLLYYNDQYLFH